MGNPKTNTGPELDDKELKVIHLFIGGMNRIASYREVFPIDICDKTIYNWYKTSKVKTYLEEYEHNLADYNVITDRVLLEIIQSEYARDSDKIKAIKLWNDTKGRITNLIKVENESTINLGGTTDEDLEKLIAAIQNGNKQ
jgi:hypothetical protein